MFPGSRRKVPATPQMFPGPRRKLPALTGCFQVHTGRFRRTAGCFRRGAGCGPPSCSRVLPNHFSCRLVYCTMCVVH
jgi:hypothetical protein